MKMEIVPQEDFVQLVREAAQWCALRANIEDPEHSLRSPELATRTLLEIWSDIPDENYDRRDATSCARFVNELDILVKRRRELLVEEPKALGKIGGRLLIHDPFNSDSSGGSWSRSERFFDEDDGPPYDTWVCWLPTDRQPGLLISWIPEVFYSLAEQGIRYSVLKCTDWIDSPRNPYYHDNPILEALHKE